MKRRLVTMFLMLCLGWQSLAFAGVGALLAHDAQEQHELLHIQGVPHLHGEHAEDFYADGSAASVVHVVLDSSQFSPALLSFPGLSPSVTGADQPSMDRPTARNQRVPDGLDRPPKPRA